MPDRIAEIRARAEAASDDWTVSAADPGVVLSEGQPIAVFGGGRQDYFNAAFTAHAHADIKWLLAENQRLQGEVTQLAAENAVLERALGLNEEVVDRTGAGDVLAVYPYVLYGATCGVCGNETEDGWGGSPEEALANAAGNPSWSRLGSQLICGKNDQAHYDARGSESPDLLRMGPDAATVTFEGSAS